MAGNEVFFCFSEFEIWKAVEGRISPISFYWIPYWQKETIEQVMFSGGQRCFAKRRRSMQSCWSCADAFAEESNQDEA